MKQFTIANRGGETERYTGLIHTDTHVYLLKSRFHRETLSADCLRWQDDAAKLQHARFSDRSDRMVGLPVMTAGCSNYWFRADDPNVPLDRRINGHAVEITDGEDVPMAYRQVLVPNPNRVVYRDAVGYGYVGETAMWVGLVQSHGGARLEPLAADMWFGRSGGLRYARSTLCNDEHALGEGTRSMMRGSGVIRRVAPVFVEHMLLRGLPDGTLASLSLAGPHTDVVPTLRLYRPDPKPWEIEKAIETYVIDVKPMHEYWSATDFAFSPCGRWLAVSATLQRQVDTDVGPLDVTGIQFFEMDYANKTMHKKCEFNFSSLHLAFSPDGQTLATFGYDLRRAKRGDGSDYLRPSGTLTVMDIDF